MPKGRALQHTIAVLFTAIVGCGGQATGTGTHVDVGSDAAAGGSRNGSGGASNGGSSSVGLVPCNDGTGNNDCCPLNAVEGGACDVNIQRCSRGGCHAGVTSYLYCGGGTWSAGKGVFPCSVDAGSDGAGSCTPGTPSCITPPTVDGAAGVLTCGSQTCGTNQFCVQQRCGGGPNPCVPLPDAGTCPSGWTFDPTCPRSVRGGCDPPPCTDPPPFCADIPGSCVSLPTGPTASCRCADSLCKFGNCVEMAGHNVTCAAQ